MRIPKVTRTIKSFKSKVIVFNDETNQSYEKEVTTLQNTDRARQAAITERLIKTIEVTEQEKNYEMTVARFIELCEAEQKGE